MLGDKTDRTPGLLTAAHPHRTAPTAAAVPPARLRAATLPASSSQSITMPCAPADRHRITITNDCESSTDRIVAPVRVWRRAEAVGTGEGREVRLMCETPALDDAVGRPLVDSAAPLTGETAEISVVGGNADSRGMITSPRGISRTHKQIKRYAALREEPSQPCGRI